MDTVLFIMPVLDFLITAYFLHVLGADLGRALLVSLFYLLGMLAFRAYDFQHLKNLLSQVSRVLVGTFLAFLMISILHIPTPWYSFIVVALITASANFLTFSILLKIIPQKTYVVDPDDFEDLKEIFREIERETLNKIHFKPANPHVLEYPPENVVITSPHQLEILKDSPLIYKFTEKYLKRIPVEMLGRFEDYYKDVFSKPRCESKIIKVLDIALSIIGLILFSPVIMLISIAIFIEDGLPIVFKQTRVGKDEKKFIMYKFRTLDKREKRPGFDAQDRMLKVGKIMRRFRVDEVLQFINVLKGDMSVVGPRPEMEIFHDEMKSKIPFYINRTTVKPGITGWAQIRYKHTIYEEDYRIKTSYDLWYVKNYSVLTYIIIVLQTAETMLFGRGVK